MIILIPPLDRFERVVTFSQTVAGRVVLIAGFVAGLMLHGRSWWPELSVILLLMSFLPAYRRQHSHTNEALLRAGFAHFDAVEVPAWDVLGSVA